MKFKVFIILVVFAFSQTLSYNGQSQNQNINLPWTLPNLQQIFTQSFAPDSRSGMLQGGLGTNVFDVMFQWNIIDFEYPTQQARANAIAARQFIPQNVVPLGIAVHVNRVFVSTPRWSDGVPASLSTISLPSNSQSPALRPYPNWQFHTSTANPDCNRLLSVYRMVIDECNRLWVIDSGVVNALTNLQQLCPPKLVVFDLSTDQQILSYAFPQEQVLQGSLHANLVVDIRNNDCNRAFVYVMDVWRNGILVFDMARRVSWRATNYLFNPDPFAMDYTYNGLNFQFIDGVFGGALSPLTNPNDDRVLFFHPMSSNNEFMVRTSILRNQTAWTTKSAPAKAFQLIGSRGRRGQSTTADMTPSGIYFAAQVQLEGVSCWDIRKPFNRKNVALIQRDPVLIGFPTDLKLDAGRDNLWIINSNLPIFLFSQFNFNQVNFRILRANVARAVAGTICDPQFPANLEPVNDCLFN